MMATANIKAVITAEDRSGSTLKGFGDKVEDVGHQIGNVVKKASIAFGSAAAAATAFSVKSAADFEQSRIAFETMLGSADKAQKMLREVSDFAAKTPFELPEVVTGAKQLLAYNIEAEKILPTFKALGNIAAGVGKDKLPQLILAFGQTRAATRLTGMELRQFTEAGVPLLTTLAKQLKKTEAEIQDMVSEGKVKFADVEKAIFGMSEEGGKFFNLMDKQSKTFSGVMSNVKDNIGRVAREIIGISDTGEIREGSIFARLSSAAQGLLRWLDANKDRIVNTAKNIFGAFQLLITGDFKKGMFASDITEDSRLVDFLFDVREAMERAIKTATDWATAIFEYLQPKLVQLWTAIRDQLIPALNSLWKNIIEPLIPVIGVALVGAVGLLIDFLTFLIDKIDIIIPVLAGFGAFLLSAKVLGAINSVAVAFHSAGGITGAIGSLHGALQGLATTNAWSLVVGAGVAAAFAIYSEWKKTSDLLYEVDRQVKKNERADQKAKAQLAALAFTSADPAERNRAAKALRGLNANGGGGGGFQTGGAVSRGVPIMVGERRPEIFEPREGGRVIPQPTMGGGHVTINISPNIGIFAGSPMERRKLAKLLWEDLKDVANQQNTSVDNVLGSTNVVPVG